MSSTCQQDSEANAGKGPGSSEPKGRAKQPVKKSPKSKAPKAAAKDSKAKSAKPGKRSKPNGSKPSSPAKEKTN